MIEESVKFVPMRKTNIILLFTSALFFVSACFSADDDAQEANSQVSTQESTQDSMDVKKSGAKSAIGPACQNQMAFPNPHPESDDQHLRHKICLQYVDAIPGIRAYADKPEFYPKDKVEMNLGYGDEYSQGSVRQIILSTALESAYGGADEEAIEKGMFCSCLSYPVAAFYDDTTPLTELE